MTFPTFPDAQLKSSQSMISIPLEYLAIATKSYYNHWTSSAPGLQASFENGWMHTAIIPRQARSSLVSRTITHNFSPFFHHLPKSRVKRQPCYCCFASRAITSTPELGSQGVLFSIHVAVDRLLSRAKVALPPFNALVQGALRLPVARSTWYAEQWRPIIAVDRETSRSLVRQTRRFQTLFGGRPIVSSRDEFPENV